MKKTIITAFWCVLSITLFYSCVKENQNVPNEKPPLLPAQTYDYTSQIPFSLSGRQQITNNGATLGRVLFYDKQLSYNNQVACASCHLQSNGFADKEAFSKGFNGDKTTRNAMSIANMGAAPTFFWDCRSNSLEEMVLMPIQNHIEMGFENLTLLEAKLNGISYYQKLFSRVFNKPKVEAREIASALAQFVASITTQNSKFDQLHLNGVTTFTAEEQAGAELFDSKELACSHCHVNDVFFSGGGYNGPAGIGFANNGLEMTYIDKGVEQSRMTISNGEGFFKVPNLRNVELTAPYMHDGRFKTLEEVIEHYNSGVNQNKDLDKHLIDPNTGKAKKMNLTPVQKQQLVAFLKTMTDRSIATDVKFSDPFNY